MDKYKLIRHSYHPYATMGYFQGDGVSLHSIERPWKENKAFESCIPEGVYICKPYSSQKYPNVWELDSVENRTKILIHVANYARDVQGCIGLGLGISSSGLMVTSSRLAIDKLRSIQGGREFELTIRSFEI